MRTSLLFPLGIGLALSAAGLLLLNGTLVATAIPLLLFATVRVLFAPTPSAADLRLTRSLDRTRTTEGDTIAVDLTLTNDRTDALLLSVSEGVPDGLAPLDGQTQSLGRLRRGESTTVSYTLLARRGLHRFDPVRVRVWSSWTLAAGECLVPIDSTVKVHPRIEKLDPIRIRPQRTRAFAGPVHANRGGQGLDFFGCRAYTPGDDIRRINWRAYARQDTLIVNEYELERIADVNVILDARARSHAQLDEDTTFDHTVRAAASLACHFLDQGNNVGLLIYGNYVQWVFPGIGRLQRERILDELAEAELGDKAVFEELRFIPTRLFPPRSQLVLVSPLVDEHDIEIVALLIDRGYSVLVVCPHSLTLSAAGRPAGDDRTVDLARGILSLKRDLFLGSLAGVGTSVIDWRVDEPLRSACQRARYARVRRYRL